MRILSLTGASRAGVGKLCFLDVVTLLAQFSASIGACLLVHRLMAG